MRTASTIFVVVVKKLRRSPNRATSRGVLMTSKSSKTRELHRDERGASLAEYALLLALMAIVCIASMAALGSSISSFFVALSSTL
jgi:Flp pilus assembly pilin Flp